MGSPKADGGVQAQQFESNYRAMRPRATGRPKHAIVNDRNRKIIRPGTDSPRELHQLLREYTFRCNLLCVGNSGTRQMMTLSIGARNDPSRGLRDLNHFTFLFSVVVSIFMSMTLTMTMLMVALVAI
jgi:hypothetical protein